VPVFRVESRAGASTEQNNHKKSASAEDVRFEDKDMAKKFTASEQQLQPDPIYNSKLVSKFINCLMKGGKKSGAQRVFYDAMDIIKTSPVVNVHSTGGGEAEEPDKSGKKGSIEGRAKKAANELEVFETAVNNVKPLLEVRSKRVGGASYQVPMQVGPARQQSLAIRWVLASARSKKGKPMCERLASELMDAYKGRGGAMTTRENVHRMAEANKAFAHFAW